MKRRDFVRTTTAGIALPFAAGCAALKPAAKPRDDVGAPEARARYLSRMLGELVTDLGPHPVGAAECMKAERIIAREMKRSMQIVETDPIPFERWVLRGEPEFTVAGKPVEACPSHGTGGTPDGGVSGVLRKSAAAGVAWELADPSSGKTIGRVIITPKEKATPRPWWFYDRETGGLPTVCIGKPDVGLLESAVASGATVRMAYHAELIPNAVTRNIIGTLPGESADEIVYYAHFDTVYNAPGANDNTASVILVLMLAHAFSGTLPKKTLTFMTTTGEEYGYLGTKDLARRWKENGRIARVKCIVSFDSVTWGPNMNLLTKDEGLVNLLLGIDRDLGIPGEPQWTKSDGLGRETIPLRDTGLAARGIVCDSVPDNYVNNLCWHRPDDIAKHVRPEPVEIAFRLFEEFMRRVQEIG